jgi:hypothetical protein
MGKKSLKSKLIGLVLKNLCKENFELITQELVQDDLNKYLAFKTRVSDFRLCEDQNFKSAGISFTDDNDEFRVINVTIGQTITSKNKLLKIN